LQELRINKIYSNISCLINDLFEARKLRWKDEPMLTIQMDVSLKNAAKKAGCPLSGFVAGVTLVASGQGFSNHVICGVIRSPPARARQGVR